MMKKICLLLFLTLPVPMPEAATEKALFSEAENHYRAGNYLLALDAYAEFADRYPLSDQVPDAQYRRALCHINLQHNNEALIILKQIEKRYRSTRYLDYIYFWQGIAHYRLENYSESIDAFTVFLGRVKDSELVPQSLLHKGLAEIALAHYSGAAATLERLNEAHFASPQGPYGLILLLYVYLNTEAFDQILNTTARLQEEDLPEKWRDRYKLYRAEAYWEKGNRDQAELIYRDLLEVNPEIAATAFRRLFLAAQAAGDLARMQDLIQQAEQRLAGFPDLLEDLWVRVGVESFKQNNLELAEYFLSRVWNLPDKKHITQAVPLYLAELLLKKEEAEEAALLLEEYLKAGPLENEATLLRLGDLRLMLGDYEEAASCYARYMEEFPDSGRFMEAGYLKAYSQYRRGALGSALDLSIRLLEGRPQGRYRQDLLRLQAFLQKKTGNLDEAVRSYRNYSSSYPDDLQAQIDYLKTLFVLKNFAEIIRVTDLLFQDFPQLAGRDPYVYILANYLRGLSQISVRDYEGALSALAVISRERVEEVNLTLILPYSLYYRGWAFYRAGSYREARLQLIDMLEQFPTHKLYPQALFLAGWCSYSLSEYETAAAHFSRLAWIDDQLSARAALLQGKSLLNMGELDEAGMVFQNLLNTHASSPFADDALFEYAGVMAGLGRTGPAADSYLELIRRFPGSSLAEEALYKRGEVYRAAGLHQEAKNAYFEFRSSFPRGRLVDAALYWGGLSALEMGERFEAVLHWEKLIDNHPESPFRPDAMKRTADMYADRGDYRKALTILSTMLSEYRQESKAMGVESRADELRYLLLGLSDKEAAFSSLIGREGGAATEQGRQAMIELSRLYIYEGSSRIDLGYQMLRRVIEKEDPNTASRAQFLIGEYFYRKGDLIRAAEEFLKAAFLNPRNADLMAASMYRAAEMMQIAGKLRDVRELVERLEKHFPDSQWTEEGKKLLELGGSP